MDILDFPVAGMSGEEGEGEVGSDRDDVSCWRVGMRRDGRVENCVTVEKA